MRTSLQFALLADGTSDEALLPILQWLLRQAAPRIALSEPGFTTRRLSTPIEREVERVIALFRPDLLFVHRDAEARDPELRRAEIHDGEKIVKVVPVRMTESWLLFSETAIRRAADRPNGRVPLDLPPLQRVEEIADRKGCLRDALLAAAEVKGRQRKRFLQDFASRVHRLAEILDDFKPLLRVPAFQRVDADVRAALRGFAVE